MAWEDWQDPKINKLWTSILDRMETAAQELASEHPEWVCEIIRTQWDAPNVEVRWTSAGLERNVNMLIRGTQWPIEIEFSGAAWVDDADGRWLKQLNLPLVQRTVVVAALNQLAELVTAALDSATYQVQSLRGALAAGAGASGN